MTVNTGTGNSILDAMLSGFTKAPTATPGTAVALTYSFMTSAPGFVVGFQPVSSSDHTLIEQALQTYSAVANITFTLVPNGGNADIMFGECNNPNWDGFTYGSAAGPPNQQTGLTPLGTSSIYYSTSGNGDSPDPVNFFLTLHELGNATGLTDFSGLSIAQDVAIGLPAFCRQFRRRQFNLL
jgi:serralysin